MDHGRNTARAFPDLSDAQSLSLTLARAACGVRFDDLPPNTVAAAQRVLLDATGVMVGASGLSPEVRGFLNVACAMGEGPCAILGTGRRASPIMAALSNGAMAHALDYEDAFDAAPGHPNASLVPVLLALAQARGGVDGRQFLTALTVGCEVSCRMGLALRQEMEVGGWYPPPILAAFGAVAGGAHVIGLTAEQTRDALSLILCQATMPGEIKHSQRTQIRAVREAFPAQAAVLSVLLAEQELAGFEEPLEGRAGFFALYAGGQFDAETLTAPMAGRFHIEDLTFKPWPSCRGTHPFIEMALALRADADFAVEDIAAVNVHIDDVQRMLTEPMARKAAPDTAIDAKFSIPFCVASALVDGAVGLDSFSITRLSDPRILALSAKVTAQHTPAPAWQRGVGGALTVTLTDGRELSAEVHTARGAPSRPLGEAEMQAKFIDCTGRAEVPLAKGMAHALAQDIAALEHCPDVGALFAL